MHYISNTKEEEKKLFSKSGVKNFSELIKIIPSKYKIKGNLGIGSPLSELEIEEELTKLSEENMYSEVCFLGSGIYDHFIPAAVDFLSNRSEFYTAYTPYQAEVSQGTLQALYEYQSMICELSGMEIANASLYDGASAIAEACMLSISVTRKSTILYSSTMHLHYKNVMKTLLIGKDINFVELPHENGITDLSKVEKYKNTLSAIIIQSPNSMGLVESWIDAKRVLQNTQALLIAHADPLCLARLKSPGECGADIYIGDGQTLGNPMNYGGPLLGIFATREKYKRQIPGRIVGKTIDKDGKEGFVLTLQTREQHIRRDRATSNICTNQGLLALRTTIYLALMGPIGLENVVDLCYQKSQYAADKINQLDNYRLKFDKNFLKEFVVETDHNVKKLIDYCQKEGFLIQNIEDRLQNCFQIAITEKRKKNEIDSLVSCLKSFK